MWIWLVIIAVAFGLPYLAVWFNGTTKTRRFVSARMSELANPHDASARFQLGQLYLKHRRYRRAQHYLEEALQLQERLDRIDPRLLDALGDTLVARGQIDEAITLYKRSLEIEAHGGQGDVFLSLGAAYQKLGQLDQAEPWLKQALASNRSLAEPVFRMACLLHKQGKTPDANKLIDSFLPDAKRLPTFIRRRNRRWIWMMYFFPFTRILY